MFNAPLSKSQTSIILNAHYPTEYDDDEYADSDDPLLHIPIDSSFFIFKNTDTYNLPSTIITSAINSSIKFSQYPQTKIPLKCSK